MMRMDVPTLIAALTTERNSLDRAIAALRLITSDEPAASRAPKITRRPHTRAHISDDTKAAIVAQMRTAAHKGEMAQSLGKQYGVKPQTIRFAFQRWAQTLDTQALDNANGNAEAAGA